MSDSANQSNGQPPATNDAAPIDNEVKTGASAPPKDDPFARKERQIRQMQKQLADEKRAWESERATKENEYKTKFVRRDQLSEDPLGTLAELGLTPEKLSELLLNAPNQNDPTVRALRAEMKAIKEQQESIRTQAEQAQTQQYEQAKKQIGNEAKMLIDSDPEFETIKAEGLYDSVVELIVETFETEGVLMDVREACSQVENYLVEYGLKFSNYNKVKQRSQPKATEQTPAVPAPSKKPANEVTVQLKTLTNQMQTGPSKKSSDAEKRARAIAAFQGKLSG